MKFIIATIILTTFVLLLEVLQNGWKDSSLSRITKPDISTKEDIFYCLLTLTKLSWLLSLITGLGIGYYAGLGITKYLGFHLLRQSNLLIQTAAMIFTANLCNYFHHRLMHSKYMWHFHKVHHAAEHFNGITSFRNHPWDNLIAMPFNAIAPAILGVNPTALGIYTVYNIIHNIALHTHIRWPRNWFFQNSDEHEIHHSSEEKHFNKNLAFTPLIDYVFGSYWKPCERPASIGFRDTVHNTNNPARSLIPF